MFINNSHNDIAEEAIHLGTNATVLQAEAQSHWEEQHPTKNKNDVINCDSQAAIMAFHNTKIKFKTTIDTVLALNKKGDNNKVVESKDLIDTK